MIEPPKGLLANAALAVEANDVSPSVVQAATPHDAPVDPNYFEPTPYVKLVDIAQKLVRLPDEEILNRDAQSSKFINVLLDRIASLEVALMPFAQVGMVMSNARLCLRAVAGKEKEPAGGHWINQVTTTHLAQTEHHYFDAIDAVGRARTEQHMMDVFQAVQDSRALTAAKKAYIEAGGRVQ